MLRSKYVELFSPKSRTVQQNPCCSSNSQVYLTLGGTFSVANDSNVDQGSPIERKGTISKDDIWFIELFFFLMKRNRNNF